MDHILPGDGAISILGFSAKIDVDTTENLVATITEEERQRAKRFRAPLDRAMFICSRSVLRRVCAIPLGCRPQKVPVVIDSFGKPGLQAGNGQIEFSLSHSSGHVLLAFASGRKLGVDLERISREVCQVDNVFFTADELSILGAAKPGHREEMFCQAWVMKEALLKAIGVGLPYPASSISIADGLLKEFGRFHPVVAPRNGTRWLVQNLGVYQNVFMVAIACEEKSSHPTVILTEINPLTLEPIPEKLPFPT
jgi:phosphopantetheinyl transferase